MRKAPPQLRAADLTASQLAFFGGHGATLKEARATYGYDVGWWVRAISLADMRGYVASPGASARWVLTIRGEIRVHQLELAARRAERKRAA